MSEDDEMVEGLALEEAPADDGANKKFVPPPKPVRTEQDWANIAYLDT